VDKTLLIKELINRPDIVLIPKDKKSTAYIFELKWESTKGRKTLDKLTEEAISQIKEKKYREGFRTVHDHENIACIGVGFKGKELKLSHIFYN